VKAEIAAMQNVIEGALFALTRLRHIFMKSELGTDEEGQFSSLMILRDRSQP
jgi:hypothetical protein